MKISVNWMKEYGGQGLDGSVDSLVARIGAQLGAVEEVVDLGALYEGIFVVKIISCVDHPNADRLHVCMIDDDGKAAGVERDANGYIQVVCGAPNVREGLMVAWLPPGSTVPSTVGKDPFVLEARPLRDVVSNGMLASARELGISDDHDGILEIDTEVHAGTPFADLYGLRDYIIDIENKMFTHRPDCFGQLGVAREVAGIAGKAFTSPDWYTDVLSVSGGAADQLYVEVRNELPELVPRFMVIALEHVAIKPSPVWLQTYLSRVGIRPINNVVDVTNYLMILTGQPLHAYDYDKVQAQDDGADHASLVIRYPKEGETLKLLNGKEVEPRREAIMIATRDKLVGVGGIMGGADTEVDENTVRIILECATFDMYSIRRTSMANGIFTDAVARFNKGQSPLQNPRILAKATAMIHELAGTQNASTVVDDNHVNVEAIARDAIHPAVEVTAQFINSRLGLQLSAQDMQTLLINVECSVEESEGTLTVLAPFWRTDIVIPEDVVEEIGRLYGYDHLSLELPERNLVPAAKHKMLSLKSTVRSVLSRAGANEVLTYSFVHGNLFDRVGQDRKRAFQLSNALSPELQYYRLSVLPNLLDKVHANVKAGYDVFALFEIGKGHEKDLIDEDGLPIEFDNLAFVYTATQTDKPGAAYYEARTFLTTLAAACNVELDFMPLIEHVAPTDAIFELGRAAAIHLKGSDESFGVVGEFTTAVRKNLKLPEKTAGFELGLGALLASPQQVQQYVALPRFPKVEQDISLKVPIGVTYGELFTAVWQKLEEVRPEHTLPMLRPIDIYQRGNDKEHKQITFRLSIAHYEKTMTDVEVSRMLDHVAEGVASQPGAERL